MTEGWLAGQKVLSQYKVCNVTEAARLVGNVLQGQVLYRGIGSLASRGVSYDTAQGRALACCNTAALALRHRRLACDRTTATTRRSAGCDTATRARLGVLLGQ